MRRTLGCLHLPVLITALVASIVLGLVATHHNYRGEVHHPISLALAGAIAALVLLSRWPVTRPRAPVRGTPASRWCGRMLIGGTYLIGAGLVGYGVYHLTTELAVVFLPSLAGIAVAAAVSRLLEKWGRHLAGFTVDWQFLQGTALLRYLLQVAVGAGVAGFSRILSHYWWAFLEAVPLTVYRWLRDTLGTAWLAIPAAILGCLVLLVALLLVATVVQRIIVQLLGPGNAAGRWLAEHAAMTWVRAPEGTVFAGGPLLPFSFSSSFPNRPGRRVVVRHRKQERRLSAAETHQLIYRIAEAALAAAPEHPHLRLTYRAAGGYEEIVLAGATTRFGPWSNRLLPEPDGAPEPAAEWELPEFPARTALRRLREAAYRAGYGTPFTLHVTVNRPAHREAAPEHRHWREAVWEETVAGAARPEWRRPPRPAEYAADLRQFPTARRMVPLWLRQELGWRWLLPLPRGVSPEGGPGPAAEPVGRETSGGGGPAAPDGGAAPVNP